MTFPAWTSPSSPGRWSRKARRDAAIRKTTRPVMWIASFVAVLLLHGTGCDSAEQLGSGASDGGVDEGIVCPPAGKRCASSDPSSPACTERCGAGEVCFTQVICGPSQGPSACSLGRGDAGDDRCHRSCRDDADCASGEECVKAQFYGCGDYSGGASGKGICVEAAAVNDCASLAR